MTPHLVVQRWVGRVGLVAGTMLFLVGCPEDADEITETASEPSFDFVVSGAYVEPDGPFEINNKVLAQFDTSVADAFGKSVAGNSNFYSDDLDVVGAGWDLTAFGRNGSEDPRTPAIVDADASIGSAAEGFVIIDASALCTGPCPFHNPFNLFEAFTNLDPSTEYVAAFARMGITINGELDANLIANGDPLDAPDALQYVDGAPFGDPTVEMTFPTFTPVLDFEANPFVLGKFTTDGSGVGAMDIIVDGSNGTVYLDNSGDPPEATFDSSLISRNDDVITQIPGRPAPRYNYLLILERNGATTAADVADNPVAMRFQIGQDFLASNEAPVNNGYAPFPARAFTDAEKVPVPGGGGLVDSLRVTFNGLERLDGGAVYEPWLVNPTTGSMIHATGTYNRIKIIAERDPITGEIVTTRDSLVETQAGVSSFVGGNEEDGFRHQLIMGDGTLAAGDTLGRHTHLMLTITSSPGGQMPSDVRPLWFEFVADQGTPDNLVDDAFADEGDTNFGNFDVSSPAGSRAFSGAGSGFGGVRENVLSVDLTRLSRPPIGYELVGWLTSEEGTVFRLPDITGPPPDRLSLVNADRESPGGLVTSTGILEANFRVNQANAGIQFQNFNTFVITLEPKSGIAGMGPIPVQLGNLPDRVINPPE